MIPSMLCAYPWRDRDRVPAEDSRPHRRPHRRRRHPQRLWRGPRRVDSRGWKGRGHRDHGRGRRRYRCPGQGGQEGGHAACDRAAPRLGQLRRPDGRLQEEVRHQGRGREPEGASQDEISAVTSRKGQDNAPDVLDLGSSFAQSAAQQGLLATYMVAGFADIPDVQRDSIGRWANDYGGYISFGCDAKRVQTCPTSFKDLLQPQYKERSRSTATPPPRVRPSAPCTRPPSPEAAPTTTSSPAWTSSPS